MDATQKVEGRGPAGSVPLIGATVRNIPNSNVQLAWTLLYYSGLFVRQNAIDYQMFKQFPSLLFTFLNGSQVLGIDLGELDLPLCWI